MRGIYVLADAKPTKNQSLVEARLRVPHGIVCLLSALRFHHLTTQSPLETWLAIDSKARLPKVDYPPIRFVRFSESALLGGIEDHRVQKRAICLTSPARCLSFACDSGSASMSHSKPYTIAAARSWRRWTNSTRSPRSVGWAESCGRIWSRWREERFVGTDLRSVRPSLEECLNQADFGTLT